MKALLVAEYRDGQLLGSYQELMGFAGQLAADSAMFVVGSSGALPAFEGTLYLADAAQVGDYNPDAHKQLLLSAIEQSASDVHLQVGYPPLLRVNGELLEVKYHVLSPEETQAVVEELLGQAANGRRRE